MLRYLDGPDGEKETSQENQIVDEAQDSGENNLTPLTIDENGLELVEADFSGGEDLSLDVTGQDEAAMLKRKIEGLEHRIGYLERIVKVSQMLNSTLSLAPLLQIMVQSATELTNTEACSIMLLIETPARCVLQKHLVGLVTRLEK